LRGDAGFGVDGAAAPELGAVVAKGVRYEGGDLLGKWTLSAAAHKDRN